MADKEVFEKNGADAASSEEARKEVRFTLESIMKEYDAKKAAAEKKTGEHSESFEAFCREQENAAFSGKEIDGQELEDLDYDDSDMKIAPSDNSIFESDFEDLPVAEKTADEPEADEALEEADETVETDETVSEDNTEDDSKNHKLDIMNAISKHFRESNPAESSKGKKAEKSEKADKAEVKVEKTEIPVGGATPCEDDCDCPEGEVCVIEDGVKRCKPIDNDALKKAFRDDGYDIFSKKKNKKKKDAEDIDAVSEDSDFAEDTSDTKITDRYTVFDENGDRIKRESRFFSPVIEYAKGSDPQQLLSKLKVKLLSSCLALIAVFVLMIISLYTEVAPTIGLPHFKQLEFGKTGVVFLMADLQILFFAVIIKLNSIARGAAGLFTGNSTSESVAFVSVLAATVHTVLVSIFAPAGVGFIPVCSVACLSVLVLAIADFLRARTEFMSFRIVSSNGTKYAFKDLSCESESTPDEIAKYVPEGSKVLDIRKVDFVDGFFAKNAQAAPADKNAGIIILVSAVVSLLVSIVYYFTNSVPVYNAVCAFASVFVATVQSCILLCTAVPESAFADRAARRKCAFIGHEVCEEFDNVSVVSFKDTEVFSPKEIKVTNIRTYGNSRIDNVIVTMARVFGTVGGPLSTVFTNSITGIDSYGDDVKLIDVAPDGLWLKLDGSNVYVGTASYMAANNFDTSFDSDDIRATDNAILYLASSDSILAKFYIKYELNRNFEKILRTLYTQGICARIKTLDPCINNDFIRAIIRRPECLFSVVKSNEPCENEKTEENISSGMVSASGEGPLISTFLLIRKMRKALAFNKFIKIASVCISFVIAALMLLVGGSVIQTAVIVVIQICWLVPVFLATKLALK